MTLESLTQNPCIKVDCSSSHTTIYAYLIEGLSTRLQGTSTQVENCVELTTVEVWKFDVIDYYYIDAPPPSPLHCLNCRIEPQKPLD